ncbi:PAS domain S-box protein [Rhodoflexus caldus]|uniref:PAS domain S-box protein n=1 Tax=Rhodoflexus caldus TaxID=2891236 RepID=UPI00202A895D|nr:PAS domain S-box protein [Rhodoflexus caldus]
MLPFSIVGKERMQSFRLAERTAEQLRKEAERATQFVEAITQGKLDEAQHTIADLVTEQPSALTRALLKMREEMQNIAAKEVERQWANEGLAKFVEILRIGTHDLELLYNSIISNLVRYVNANQGGLFVVNEEDGREPFIEMVACYAYDRRKFLQKRIEIGEGLIGQVYLEKEPIQYNALPKNYSTISSGLGAESPSALLIVPLKVNEKVVGMIELAAFQPFQPYQVDFIRKLGENIASTVANAQVSKRTQYLLRISQQQTEQLRSAEEEMRQNMEELQATQEEMQRKEMEMNGLFAAIDLTLCMVELNTEGVITSANHRFAEQLGFTTDELRGRKLHPMFVAGRKTGTFEQLWNQVGNGISQTGNYLFSGKGSRQIWLQAAFSPVKDADGNIRKVLMLGQDITANKEAEIQFQRLSLVADNTDNAVIITDAQGITEYVNRGFERMTGYKADEIIGKKPGHILQGPDTDPETVARISRKLKTKRSFSEDILNYGKDGKPYWISLTINPIFDEEGEVSKYISIQAEISKTKLQAIDLNGKMEAINRANAIIEFDTQGNILTANENFLQLMEYSLEEIKGKHHSMFVPPKELASEEYKHFWEKLGSQAGFNDGEFERITKSGKSVWLRGNYNTIVDHLGRPTKVIKIVQDISAEKVLLMEIQQNNEELKTQEEEIRQNMEELLSIQEALQAKQKEAEAIAQKFTNILEGCADSVVTIDKTGTISFFNAAAEQMWGYERSEVIGKNVKMLMFSEHATHHDRYLHNYETTRQKKVIGIGREVEARRKDGSKVPILLTLSEASFEGESVYTAFIKDITKQKELEQQTLQQIEELRTQEEEIRQNMEELLSIQEALQAKQKEAEAIAQKFTNILEGCADSVVTIDKTGTISFFNAAAEQMWGYERSEVIGKNVKMLMFSEHATHHDRYLHNYETTRQKKVIGIGREVEARRKDGSKVPILLTLSEASFEGESVYTAFIKDITKQKELELQTQQQMEELRTQEEEIRQNLEELQANQEEMQRTAMNLNGLMAAIDTTMATIEFDMEGLVLDANTNFLEIMGYRLEEITGKPHRLFVDAKEASTPDYIRFWDNLRMGRPFMGEVKRLTKNGEEKWFNASYMPVMDRHGKPVKVIKLAQEITKQKMVNLDVTGQLDAIRRSFAVAEFDMKGHLTEANENFLDLFNYGINEVVGRHHKLFAGKEESETNEYAMFWTNLRSGKAQDGEFKLFNKAGHEVIARGSYNPIMNLNGEPYKVVAYLQQVIIKKNGRSKDKTAVEATDEKAG